MADILIRNVKIPQGGFIYGYITSNGSFIKIGRSFQFDRTDDYIKEIEEMPKIYSTIEVPDHGDLISREWLIENWDKYVYTLTAIEAAPVIIPASEKGEIMNERGCPPDYNGGLCADYDVDCKACWKQWKQEHKAEEGK